MASSDSTVSTAQPPVDRALQFARSWWPITAFLVPVIVVQSAWSARYDVAGHAAGHLASATTIFPMAFVCAVLLWALPGGRRRDPVLWLLLASVLGSSLVVLVGNVRVIDAIGAETWTDDQASQLGSTRPGFASGHGLAALGALGAVVAAMLIAGLLWRRRLVSPKVAIASAALSLVFPHWIVPGFGMVVVAIAAVVARARRRHELNLAGAGAASAPRAARRAPRAAPRRPT